MVNPFHSHDYIYEATHKDFPSWTLWRCTICNKFYYHDRLSNCYNRVKYVDWTIWKSNIPYEEND